MPTFEIVDKEVAHALVAGSLYPGGAIRVIMRSPSHVMFSSLGVQLWNRDPHSSHSIKMVSRVRPNKELIASLTQTIDKVFGEGAAAQVITAGRSRTVLVDGGGEKMALPNKVVGDINRAAYDAVKPDWQADLTGQIKTCKQCGEALKPSTDHHRLGFVVGEDHPRTVEQCQRKTNRPVIAVHGYGVMSKDRYGLIEWFETWDGESYLDEDFCNNRCAADYGRRAARALPVLEPGGEVPKTEHRIREDVSHADPEAEAKLREASIQWAMHPELGPIRL